MYQATQVFEELWFTYLRILFYEITGDKKH